MSETEMEFELDTHPGRTLSLLLFHDVKNSKDLLQSMQTGTLDPELAFLNASLVPATFPLLAAAHKALVSQADGKVKSRTIHSELVYNYSGSKHIRESLLRCGITDSTTYILVARFDPTPKDLEAVRRLVQGIEVELTELPKRADEGLIRKHYKISPVEMECTSLEDAITCRIAARDAL